MYSSNQNSHSSTPRDQSIQDLTRAGQARQQTQEQEEQAPLVAPTPPAVPAHRTHPEPSNGYATTNRTARIPHSFTVDGSMGSENFGKIFITIQTNTNSVQS